MQYSDAVLMQTTSIHSVRAKIKIMCGVPRWNTNEQLLLFLRHVVLTPPNCGDERHILLANNFEHQFKPAKSPFASISSINNKRQSACNRETPNYEDEHHKVCDGDMLNTTVKHSWEKRQWKPNGFHRSSCSHRSIDECPVAEILAINRMPVPWVLIYA